MASRNLPTEPGHATPGLQQGAEATQSLASHPDHREVLGYTGTPVGKHKQESEVMWWVAMNLGRGH